MLRNGGVRVQVDGLPFWALGARPPGTSWQVVAITIATGELLGHGPANVTRTGTALNHAATILTPGDSGTSTQLAHNPGGQKTDDCAW